MDIPCDDDDDDMLNLVRNMAEKENLKLTTDQLKDLLEYAEQTFSETLNEEEDITSSEIYTPALQDDATEGTPPDLRDHASDESPPVLRDHASDESPPDLQDNASDVNPPNVQDSASKAKEFLDLFHFDELHESFKYPPCAECVKFRNGYPMPEVYSWDDLFTRLYRRVTMQQPPLPSFVLHLIQNPYILWCIMERYAFFSSDEEVQRSLRSKHGVRNLYWKGALAAMYRCYDAFFILRHAALRLTRGDFKSAFILHNAAMTHIRKKVMYDTKKFSRREMKARASLSEKEVIPLTFRKYYRCKKKVCKVKPVKDHYFYRDRSLIKKHFLIRNAKLKQLIIQMTSENPINLYQMAFENPIYLYSSTGCIPYFIGKNLIIEDYDDGVDIRVFQLENCLSDTDSLFLREDVSRLLKRAREQNSEYCNFTETSGKNSMDHSNKNGSIIMQLNRFLESGEIGDWVEERDFPLLIDEIERKDRNAKKPKAETVVKKFDELVKFVLNRGFPQSTSTIDAPMGLEKNVVGENSIGPSHIK